ncbi:MAG: LysM peptidoglycan-binding domain-containing protein [Christensenellales bacterium]
MPEKNEILKRTYWETLGSGLKSETTSEKRLKTLGGMMGTLPAMDRSQAVCPEGFFQHVIRQGESLIIIAQRYNISLTELMSYNPNINPYFYTTGQVLCIPAAGASTCPNGTLYAIREGDTLYSIAGLYGTTAQDLQDANSWLDPLNIIPGQVICVPGARPSQTCPDGEEPYVFNESDSLVSVLRQNSISYGALQESNPNLNLAELAPGTLLCIPPSGSRGACNCTLEGLAYRMGSDENLTTLADRIGISEELFVISNPMLTPSDFVSGQIVCIPFAVEDQ